ncbi:DUF4132 domain-containing protein [Nonomuraea sp. NEAU-A123]|uniref:DUF4132 domain-containing protein n=1 Tax=Nonomuraea sp. NEAU-A123 TaxID=2839649 RepID=UPI001BE4AB84|nr:DUF4132 domain-containing protein [Nonomuraea sp. NEAU-A123]MBT2235316.1 DUF4132 domain-containing protein [Nonomuraea sp. NEAU-A123]
MHELTVDETVTSAFVAASWVMETIERERELRGQFHSSLRQDDRDERRAMKLRREAEHVRRELVRRLRRAEGADRRAAAICLAQPGLDDYFKEVKLALSGSSGWTATDVAALLSVVHRREPYDWDDTWVSQVVDLALDFDITEQHPLREPLTRLIEGMADSSLAPDDRRRLQRRIALALRDDPTALPLSALVRADAWASSVREYLGDAPAPHLVELVEHLCELRTPRPGKKWRARCLTLLEPADARELVRFALAAFVREPSSGRHGPVVSASNTEVARGAIWAATLARADGLVADLTWLAVHLGGDRTAFPQELAVAGAAINALGECGECGDPQPLWRLRTSLKNRALRKQIDTALATAAEHVGTTPAQLLERGVPTHGLAADGTRSWRLGDHTAVLTVQDAVTVRLGFTAPDDTTIRALPPAVSETHAEELKAIKSVQKEVRQTLAAERARLEELFTVDRTWSYEDWVRHYLNHPITAVVARGLIWEAGGRTFLPGDAPPGVEVRPWHPARAPLEEVAAWRETMTGRRLRQPYKQAFREVYLLTPAEETTGVYSNRFAAHIVDHPRLYALLKKRGWQTTWLRASGDHDAVAKKELAEGAWRARFRYETAAVADHEVTLAATDQIRFDRRAGRAWRETPLAQVPPLVFSEAMRDVDLFVAVTSIAADPDWIDRGEERFGGYWREVSVGALPPSAEVRRDALARILPRTAVADRCTLTDRYLVVRGDLRTYRIHLGSGNILMDPGDVYLCIVTARKRDARLFLPFEEDGRLALILSKAFLLAHDNKITDESILQQIHRM